MKKGLFIAIAVVGFSSFTFAQSADKSDQMVPAPSQKTSDKETTIKRESAARAQSRQVKQPAAAPLADLDRLKSAGATEAQLNALTPRLQALDKQKTDIEKNIQLTPTEKQKALDAISIERNAVLQKGVGEQSYKKYLGDSKNDAKIQGKN